MPFYCDVTQANFCHSQNPYDSLTASLHESIIVHSEYFASCLKVAGRNAHDSIRLLDTESLKPLPLIFQTELSLLFEKNSALKPEFESFITLFCDINHRAEKHQQRNSKLFFFKYHDSITQFINIMGIEGIRYLRKQLAFTVLSLERLLEAIPILTEKQQDGLATYFKQHTPSPDVIDHFKTCIITLGLLNQASNRTDESAEDYVLLAENKTIADYNLSLARCLLDKMFLGIQVQLSAEEISTIFEQFDTQKLIALIAASQHMAADEYREVYLNLLRLDLTHRDIHDFLHNTEQESSIGKTLALHNQRIRTELNALGIVTETALNYQKTLDFSVSPENNNTVSSQESAVTTLKSYMARLEKTLPIPIPSPELDMGKLLKNIQQHLIGSKRFPDLESAGAKKLLGQLNADLKALDRYKDNLPRELNEFSEHTRQHCDLIKKNKPQSKNSTYEFHVEQWHKEKADTFFLGDNVGCCLATNNAQFQAIVQRRMDDAMLFHVAIDKKTQKPAALIWLYLAETANGQIVLMANFCEVNAKYATNSYLRQALLNGLLQFTHQYCEDNPKISAFYMNKLKYGWNMHDLDHYNTETVVLSDKVGGPYIPGMTPEQVDELHLKMNEDSEVSQEVKQYTQKQYYLVSLNETQFYRFDPVKLEPVNRIPDIQAPAIEHKKPTHIKMEMFPAKKPNAMESFDEISKEVPKNRCTIS